MTGTIEHIHPLPSPAPQDPHAELLPHEAPVVSKRWKWTTVLGTAAVGACEIVAGNTTALATTMDGAHNLLGDSLSYAIQTDNVLNQNVPEEKRKRLRKLSYWMIHASSLGAMTIAGMEIGQEHTAHPGALYTSAASLALSGLLLVGYEKGKRRKGKGNLNHHEQDLSKHLLKVDIPSAALAVSDAVLQRYHVDTYQSLSMLSGALGAWWFRPTKKNLAHNCLVDEDLGEHDDHDHHDHHHHSDKNSLREFFLPPGRHRRKGSKPKGRHRRISELVTVQAV
ncbi:MAG TPA: hypothetical protein VLA92_04160 [Candidatus Saccharimonadales bacterium]|nr:hypothetical protein [Candidatus Saccharimonadales bacterium]